MRGGILDAGVILDAAGVINARGFLKMRGSGGASNAGIGGRLQMRGSGWCPWVAKKVPWGSLDPRFGNTTK